ncbi:MAG: hypothetical protein QM500_00500 [Methylococcales bacterium]
MEVIDDFEMDEGAVEIQLEDIGDSLKMVARYKTGELVNGYSYTIDKITECDLRQVSALDAIADLAVTVRNDVETYAWERYKVALNELSKKKAQLLN